MQEASLSKLLCVTKIRIIKYIKREMKHLIFNIMVSSLDILRYLWILNVILIDETTV